MRFEFATASRIIFGPGTLEEVPALAAGFGRRALVVGGSTPARTAWLVERLTELGIACASLRVSGEPTVALAKEGAALARRAKSALVIALGGGSVLDSGKAIAALTINPGEPEDYLEVVGRGLPLSRASLPCIAIPSTAGTGAEVTRNAVLGVPESRVKVSLRSPGMLPAVALVDPRLTLSLPRPLTLTTGLDALTQLIEAFSSNKANPLTDSLCREGISRAGRSLRKACTDGGDIEAREDLSLASLCSGLALANARLGAVHGLAGPLGGMLGAPHGAICARLLPFVLEANLKAIGHGGVSSGLTARYAEIARLLTGKSAARAVDCIHWVKELCAEFAVPALAELGLREEEIPPAVAQARKSSSMQGNPVALEETELRGILEKAL